MPDGAMAATGVEGGEGVEGVEGGEGVEGVGLAGAGTERDANAGAACD